MYSTKWERVEGITMKWSRVDVPGDLSTQARRQGRLSIPTRYRDILKEKYPLRPQQDDLEIILCYIGPHISAYPRVEWDRLADALSEAIALPGLHQDARNLEHMLFGNAAECPIDSQGRVVIPPHLRTKGKLNSEITIVGHNRYFEVWDRTTCERYDASLQGYELLEIAQKIVELRDSRILARPSLFDDGLRPGL
jgi:MraZ protein